MRTPWSVVSDVHDDAPLSSNGSHKAHASKLLVILMFASETTALLRAVLNEVCRELPADETGTRTHVASRILEAASRGETSIGVLKQIGQTALTSSPTMWPQKAPTVLIRQPWSGWRAHRKPTWIGDMCA